jgi:hypothetical protein
MRFLCFHPFDGNCPRLTDNIYFIPSCGDGFISSGGGKDRKFKTSRGYTLLIFLALQ